MAVEQPPRGNELLESTGASRLYKLLEGELGLVVHLEECWTGGNMEASHGFSVRPTQKKREEGTHGDSPKLTYRINCQP